MPSGPGGDQPPGARAAFRRDRALLGATVARARFGWREPRPASTEHVAQFGPMLSALRWVSLSLALALALIEHLGPRAAVAGGVLVAYTLWRTVWPIGGEQGRWQTTAALLLEVAVGVAVVEATGFARSPFLITLGVATVIAGFAGGLRVVSGLAVIAGAGRGAARACSWPRTAVDANARRAVRHRARPRGCGGRLQPLPRRGRPSGAEKA